MNNDRDRMYSSYGSYNRQYEQGDNNGRQYGRGDERGRQPQYRQDREDWPGDRDNTRRQSPESRRYEQSRQQAMRGQDDGYRNDYYNVMYDTSNYYATPRGVDYGLPYGAENDLDKTDHYAHPDWVYGDRRTPYRYSMGYNPNYDNPAEGDLYRDFDSRGNHGFRHDAGYGNEDEFREFGNDRFGRPNHTENGYYGHFGGYNR
ncbi:hypothetical protein [Pontibacter harenae]|uniref:hypothetical protein n=1 Tax=Pontibacter harenae TaxID=2894083 RepID=UPI001E59AA23|nr:hypothetical protein [Pontibacter harenae]MCC9167498.1 hypothetical protein [Pontibacter harenae]